MWKYLQGIIQSANVAIFSVDQICLWEETPSPIWNQDIFLEVLLPIPLCEEMMVRQCSSGQRGWLNTNPMAARQIYEQQKIHTDKVGMRQIRTFQEINTLWIPNCSSAVMSHCKGASLSFFLTRRFCAFREEMWGMCLSRKWGGISLGIGFPSCWSTSLVNRSGRKSRTVAIRLMISIQVRNMKTERRGSLMHTLILFHPTKMGWESRWFLSQSPTSIDQLIEFALLSCRT